MTRFVVNLRTRPDVIRLAAVDASDVWSVRVQAADAWDAVRVDVLPLSRVRDVKHAAMAQLLPDVDHFDDYVVKLRGIEVVNEDASMEAVGAADGSTLLIMSRRRRPVR